MMSKKTGVQRGHDGPERETGEWNIPNCFVKCTFNFRVVLLLWKKQQRRSGGSPETWRPVFFIVRASPYRGPKPRRDIGA